MIEESLKVCEGVVIEYSLRQVVGAHDNVAHGAQRGRLDLDIPVAEERHQLGHYAAVDDHLDLPPSVRYQGPHCVHNKVLL